MTQFGKKQELGNHKYPVCYATFQCRYQHHDKKKRKTKFCRFKEPCNQQRNILFPLLPNYSYEFLVRDKFGVEREEGQT